MRSYEENMRAYQANLDRRISGNHPELYGNPNNDAELEMKFHERINKTDLTKPNEVEELAIHFLHFIGFNPGIPMEDNAKIAVKALSDWMEHKLNAEQFAKLNMLHTMVEEHALPAPLLHALDVCESNVKIEEHSRPESVMVLAMAKSDIDQDAVIDKMKKMEREFEEASNKPQPDENNDKWQSFILIYTPHIKTFIADEIARFSHNTKLFSDESNNPEFINQVYDQIVNSISEDKRHLLQSDTTVDILSYFSKRTLEQLTPTMADYTLANRIITALKSFDTTLHNSGGDEAQIANKSAILTSMQQALTDKTIPVKDRLNTFRAHFKESERTLASHDHSLFIRLKKQIDRIFSGNINIFWKTRAEKEVKNLKNIADGPAPKRK